MKKITITEDRILIEGFEDEEFAEPGKSGLSLGSCRDVGRLGLIWAIHRLSIELGKDLIGEWDKQISVVDS